MAMNKEQVRKYKFLNTYLNKMRPNAVMITCIIIGSIWALLAIFMIIQIIRGKIEFDVSRAIMIGILVLFIVIAVVSEIIKNKKDYLNRMLKNTGALYEVNDEARFVESVISSIKSGVHYKSMLLTVTKDYLISYGDSDVYFNPVIIPRNMITKIDVTDKRMGIMDSKRRITFLQIELNNNQIAYLILSGSINPGPVNKLQKIGLL